MMNSYKNFLAIFLLKSSNSPKLFEIGFSTINLLQPRLINSSEVERWSGPQFATIPYLNLKFLGIFDKESNK